MKQMKMKSGNFYSYYKPSCVNSDASFAGQEINEQLLQVYENYCRDEFFLKDDLANKVVEQGLVNLDQLTCLEFSTLFARLGSVSYAVNTDMKEFKRKLNDSDSDKPLLLVFLH